MKRFLVAQIAIVSILFSGGWNWFIAVNNRPRLPRLNDLPRALSPQHNYPFVVTDDQLNEVLERAKPNFDKSPKVNFVDHALRLWGSDVLFEDGSLDGPQMLEMMLNDTRFRQTWGNETPALLTRSVAGIEVQTQVGRTTVSHVDHLVGTLAEIGVELSHEVISNDGPGTVGDLLRHAILNFHLNQKEYEWTALAAALYTVDGDHWYCDEGQEISFDSLADRMMRQHQPLGVCYGQHRLYSLVMMLRVDDQLRNEDQWLFSLATRQKVKNYLLAMTRRFHKNQSREGYWDGNWTDTNRSIPDPGTDELSRRILATGHVLEWWAMAPNDLHPPRETIIRAAQWLARNIIEMDKRQIEANYTFITHAARALSLWRGQQAEDFYIGQSTKKLVEFAMESQNQPLGTKICK